jgi:di/tricarboxylate transporter
VTFEQGAAFAIVAAMMALFVWDRLRYDLVALLALFAAVMVGIVPAEKAFTGFSDEVVVIVATALLVSAAVARSGVAELAIRPLGPYLKSLRAQVFVLVLAVTLLSTFIKNVGALAILVPVAFQLAKRANTSPSQLLMPLAFGSLLGGLITMIGTSPNIIVSRVREEVLGKPFAMFDYAPVGLGLAALGLVCITLTCGILPKRKGAAALNEAIDIGDYVVEAKVPPGSPLVGQAANDVEALAEDGMKLTKVVRESPRGHEPHPNAELKAGDTLLLKGDPEDLDRAIERGGLDLGGQGGETETSQDEDTVGNVEGVITSDSMLVRSTPAAIRLRERFGLSLLAISRSGEDLSQRLSRVRFRAGDVVVLRGERDRIPDALKDLGILPLAEREVPIGRVRQRWVPVSVLAAAMAAAALEWVPVAIAFFGAGLVLLLARSLSLREAYETIEWPIVILLGALIPVSEAVRATGASDLVAGWLSSLAGALPAMGALALVLAAAMAVTPFLNNAATVLMMAPIAASLADRLGLNVDPFLMAVAVGAACDFLTPFGHQCNTLVMGPGGYRFGDYWKLGLPLSLMVIAAGTPLIAWIWGLR